MLHTFGAGSCMRALKGCTLHSKAEPSASTVAARGRLGCVDRTMMGAVCPRQQWKAGSCRGRGRTDRACVPAGGHCKLAQLGRRSRRVRISKCWICLQVQVDWALDVWHWGRPNTFKDGFWTQRTQSVSRGAMPGYVTHQMQAGTPGGPRARRRHPLQSPGAGYATRGPWLPSAAGQAHPLARWPRCMIGGLKQR